MDFKKIFVKDACPTKIGGQAVMEGIMMRGENRAATVIRLPNKKLHIRSENVPGKSRLARIPFIRGVAIFLGSLIQGTKTLMYSADVLESYDGPGAETYEKGKFELWMIKKFGEKGAWDIMLYSSIVLAVFLTVGIFIIGPTWVIDLLAKVTDNAIVLNLVEGVLRIILFIAYVLAISKMNEIHRVFQYHGAEHKTIHCYEAGLELTPSNCRPFYTLHPRCGTSFLMFVMIISLILFSLLGWPNLFWRITSRLLLLPVIAGISYELLKWAGRSDNWFVKVLSMPGLYLQKLTTAEPDDEQLEVAIAAMKAVLAPAGTPLYEGICGPDGNPASEIKGDIDENKGITG